MADDPAIAHLRRVDPALARLIDALAAVPLPERPDRPKPGEHYAALVRTIVGQQLSTKAARSIYNRLLEHFGGRPPTPEQVLAADPEELRAAAGLSRSKTTYLRSLAEHVVNGSLELGRLEELDDDAVIEELIAVKGIGDWSAHMFLMFQLGRPDVVAPGDLGIRRGIQLTYGLQEMPTPAEVVERAESWRPFRTAACMLLWRSLDATPAD
ncbi:MAG TPA: DNA-3-methyladenine glycosylase [Solirubrobacteraceae bacterium]|jgi:DNA-3-methyladenine glycosylase II